MNLQFLFVSWTHLNLSMKRSGKWVLFGIFVCSMLTKNRSERNFMYMSKVFIDYCLTIMVTIFIPEINRSYSDHKKHKKSAIGTNNEAGQLEKSSSKYYIPSSTFLIPDNGLGASKSKSAETFRTEKSKVFPEDHEPWSRRILDPGRKIVLKWNRVFICSCLLALFVDPLYLYLPSLAGNGKSSCVRTDWKLRIVVTCFRTVADFFYLLHMIIKFRTAYVAPSSRVFGRGELVMDSKMIAKRYLRSDFFVDLIATLPLPQVLHWDFRLSNFDFISGVLCL